MKKPVKAILAVGIAMVLISGIAYAADKKKRTKQQPFPPDSMPDEEAVKAELLAAVEGKPGKALHIDDKVKIKDQKETKGSVK